MAEGYGRVAYLEYSRTMFVCWAVINEVQWPMAPTFRSVIVSLPILGSEGISMINFEVVGSF